MCRLTVCLFVGLLATPAFAEVQHATARTYNTHGYDLPDNGLLSASAASFLSNLVPPSGVGGDFAYTAHAVAIGGPSRGVNDVGSFHLRTWAKIEEVSYGNTNGGTGVAGAEAYWSDTFRIRIPSGSPTPTIRVHFSLTGTNTLTRVTDPTEPRYPSIAFAGTFVSITGNVNLNAARQEYASFNPATGYVEKTSGETYFDIFPVLNRDGSGDYYANVVTYLTSGVSTDFGYSVESDYFHTFNLTEATLVDGRPLSDEGITIWLDSQLEVPEPTSFLLGLIALGTCAWLKARRAN